MMLSLLTTVSYVSCDLRDRGLRKEVVFWVMFPRKSELPFPSMLPSNLSLLIHRNCEKSHISWDVWKICWFAGSVKLSQAAFSREKLGKTMGKIGTNDVQSDLSIPGCARRKKGLHISSLLLILDSPSIDICFFATSYFSLRAQAMRCES